MITNLFVAVAALSLGQSEPEPIREFCPMYFIFFDNGSTRISPQARAVIDNWASWARLIEAPFNRYTIQVSTDGPGSPEYNLNLSWRRGQAVVRYLVSQGFPADRFRVRAMGESYRLVDTADAEAQNRQAVLILESTLTNVRQGRTGPLAPGEPIC
jgi:outer membrane protein OmpA-like peptidoglycan-associated protein